MMGLRSLIMDSKALPSIKSRGRGCCTAKCYWASETIISEELASSSSPPIQMISPLNPYTIVEVPHRLPRVNMAKEFVKGLRDCKAEDGLFGLVRDYTRYLDEQAITALGSFLADAASGKREFLSSRSSLLAYARDEWAPLFMDNIHRMDHVGLYIGIQSLVKITSLAPSGYSILDGDDVLALLRAADEIMHLCSPRSAVEIISGLWKLGSDAGLCVNNSPLPLPWITRFLACALPSSSLLRASPQDLGVLLRCLAKIRQHQNDAHKAQKLHQKEQKYYVACDNPRHPFSRKWAMNLVATIGRKAPYMNLREIGTVSWSLAVLEIDPGSNVLNAIWKQSEGLLSLSSLKTNLSLSTASLGGLCYSLCCISHPPPASLLAMIKLAVSHSLNAEPLMNGNTIEAMNARDLMLLLMALGRWTPQQSINDEPWHDTVSQALERGSLISSCSSSSIAGILCSLSQLGIRPSKEVMHQAEKRILSLKQGTSSAVSARLLTAFCALGYVPCSSLGSLLVAQLVDHMDHIAAKRFFPAALAVIKLKITMTEEQLRALVVGPQSKYEHVRGMKNLVQHAQVINAAWRVLGARDSSGFLHNCAERLISAAAWASDHESGQDQNQALELARYIRNQLDFGLKTPNQTAA